MAHAYLIIGSNLGDRLQYFIKAKNLLKSSVGKILKQSLIYETEPWGYHDKNLYLNQVLLIDTSLNPVSLLNELKNIETSLGRILTHERYSARCIDIDILFYQNMVINTPELVIPHPEIANRRFVLEPLAGINPLLKHPVFLKTCAMLLAECKDDCKVKVLERK
jgi:2-amino-4-hydroxy-6-hydroxymethyldihydropteridine diphosphokinase